MAIGLRSLIRARVWLAEHLLLDHRHALLVAAAAIGALGAVTTWAFTYAISALQRLSAGSGDPQVVAAALPSWRILLTPALGGVLAGAVLLLGQRLARGQSSTDYMEALVLGDGAIPTRTTLAKSASSLVTIGSGGSIGREGSLVQLSAWLASQMARLFRMPASRRRLLVACGAAAGIAAAYNAPLAGAIFVSEIVMRTIAVETLGPLLLASVTASALSRQLLQAEPVFGQPGFTLSSPWELLPYAGLGLIAGFAAPLYLTVLDGARRVFTRVALPAPAALALGGLLVGAVALAEPRVWGNGAGVIGDLLREPWTAGTLAVLLVGKLVATAATSGSGAVGGVFTPTLLIGAALGGLAGSAAHALWPQTVVASAPYALVGMAAFLAATTHAPLMAIVMAFEMTLDYEIILPLMLTCVVAHQVAFGIRPVSVYDLAGKARKRAEAEPAAGSVTVAQLLVADPPAVAQSARFSEVARAFLGSRHNHLFVTDSGGRLVGAIVLHDIKPYLADADLDAMVVAADLASPIPSVTPATPLSEALAALARHPGNRLPVVEQETGRLIGAVHKFDLHLAFAQESAAPAAPQHPPT